MSYFTGLLTNLLVGFVSMLLLLFNVSDVDKTQTPIDLGDFEMTFEDNFDGDELNTENWHIHNQEGIRRGGYWTEEQAHVEDGNLVIHTEYKEDGKFGAGWYTSGISTQDTFEQTYGYYECRCILPKGSGMWSAFWLTNSNVSDLTTGKADKGAEIDVFESPYWHLGDAKRNKVTSNIHFNGYDLLTRYKNVCITALDNDPYEEYNTYGVLWTEDEYIYYVNGYEVGRSDYGGVSGENEYLILSCEIEGADGKTTDGWSGKITSNGEGFTADYLVDYVRVYQKKTDSGLSSREDILNAYKEAAAKTDADGVDYAMSVSVAKVKSGDKKFDKKLSPAIASEAEKYCKTGSGITGDYMKLTVDDIAAAKAYDDGNYTTISITLRRQTDSLLTQGASHHFSNGITPAGDVEDIIGAVDSMKLDASEGDISFTYGSGVITVKIDNATGLIVSGSWSYEVKINATDTLITLGEKSHLAEKGVFAIRCSIGF